MADDALTTSVLGLLPQVEKDTAEWALRLNRGDVEAALIQLSDLSSSSSSQQQQQTPLGLALARIEALQTELRQARADADALRAELAAARSAVPAEAVRVAAEMAAELARRVAANAATAGAKAAAEEAVGATALLDALLASSRAAGDEDQEERGDARSAIDQARSAAIEREREVLASVRLSGRR